MLTSGAPRAGGAAKASLLGTSRRTDGTVQVTYNGHPLYYYSGDSHAGQTNGEGINSFGGYWYVVSPNGQAIQ
ncbi:MAG: COG4315 family predicted lipoprotein [Mycobacteriales bacterium]